MKQKYLIVGIALIIAAIGIILVSGYIRGNTPTTPSNSVENFFKNVDFSISGTPLVNQPVETTATAQRPSLNVSDSTVEILLPEGLESVSGNLRWQGNLKENETVQIKGTIKAVKTGNWAIQFSATANPPTGFAALETKFLYVSVSSNTAKVTDTPIPGINYIGPGQMDSLKSETTKIK